MGDAFSVPFILSCFRTIVPDVTYGMLVWGTCCPSLLYDGELIHLRAAEIIHGLAEVNIETLKRIHWQPLTQVNLTQQTNKKDQALLDELSFEKEAWLIANKDDHFHYFEQFIYLLF